MVEAIAGQAKVVSNYFWDAWVVRDRVFIKIYYVVLIVIEPFGLFSIKLFVKVDFRHVFLNLSRFKVEDIAVNLI